jgi:hypothetical protein
LAGWKHEPGPVRQQQRHHVHRQQRLQAALFTSQLVGVSHHIPHDKI